VPVAPVFPVAPAAEVKEKAPPELLPVPASVFDDDFFRHTAPARGAVDESSDYERAETALPERFREPTHYSAPPRVQQEDVRKVTDVPFTADTLARGPSFGGPVSDHSEPDELDIPAFLRRGN
jgi:cell division protein FtsZ